MEKLFQWGFFKTSPDATNPKTGKIIFKLSVIRSIDTAKFLSELSAMRLEFADLWWIHIYYIIIPSLNLDLVMGNKEELLKIQKKVGAMVLQCYIAALIDPLDELIEHVEEPVC